MDMEPEKEGKAKKRSLKQRIRDTKRLLSRVRYRALECISVSGGKNFLCMID